MGDVDEHASAEDPVRVGRDVETAGTSARDGIRRSAVVELALVCDMAECIHVRVAVTVKLDSQEVRGKASVTRADIHFMRSVDVIQGRIRIVRAGDGVDRDRERYPSST